MVRYNNNKLGEIIDSKVVNLANNDVIKLHQRAKLNGVVDSKLKSLEKDGKEKSMNEIKESSYRESKAPKIEEVNFVVIDEEGKKISSKEAIEKIERKSLEKNEDNSMSLIELPTILSIGLNEPTNKDKLLSFAGINRNRFNEDHETIQVLLSIITMSLAKKNGFNKDIDYIYLKPDSKYNFMSSNNHYGSADMSYFNVKDNYFYTEQFKFNCCNLKKLSYFKSIDYDKIWELFFFNENTDRICISYADRSEFIKIIEFLNTTDLKLPFNFIINDLSPLNNVDINFDNDNFIKYSIDNYFYSLNHYREKYINAEINYWNYFNKLEHKFQTKSKFDEQFKLNKFEFIEKELKYNGDNKYEKTIDFYNYKIYDTYECKPYSGCNDNLKSLNGNKINSDIKTVGEFRLNFTSCVKKGIDLNKNNMEEVNIN